MAKIVLLPPDSLQSPERPVSPPPGAPALSHQDIIAWTGETSIKRGAPYVGEALFDMRRTGYTLKARCQGTAAYPYRVTAMIGSQGGITQSMCSCPVGGRCKHVAALLLSWLRDPDAFMEIEDAETTLERRDKAELIALIRQMLARHPELETLLELPLPVAGKQNKPADLARIRREIASAFRAVGDDWNGASEVAQSLEALVELGNEYARLDDWRNAATVYQAITQGVAEHYEEVQDEESDLSYVVDTCVEGIGTCLQSVDDPAQREVMLQALFELYQWDVASGGYGMADQVPAMILDQSTPAERQLVADWVRDVLPTGDGTGARWRQQAFGGFLLQLAGDEIDDESFLQICRETGRHADLVERLLTLGRLDEVEAEVRQADDGEILRLADLMRKHGQTDRAEQLVRTRHTAAATQWQMTAWLRDRARERGDADEALALTETLFWRHPSLSGYDEVKEAAQALGSWDTLRPELLRKLDQNRSHALQTEIHLQEGEIEQALATLHRGGNILTYGDNPLAIRVARAAEEKHPAEAIAIYRNAAERLIQGQGRENYRAAARHLARIRDMYLRHGADPTWHTLIAKIRTDNQRLRALREELERAGL